MDAVHYVREELVNNKTIVYLDAVYESDVTSEAIPAAISYLDEHPLYDEVVLGILFASLTIPRGTTLNEAINMWEENFCGKKSPSKDDGRIL